MRASIALQPAVAAQRCPSRLQRPRAAAAALQRAPAAAAASQTVGLRWAAQPDRPLAAGPAAAAVAAAGGRRLSLRCSASAQPVAASAEPLDTVSEVARQNLKKAANACRRYGWISFWVQLVLNSVAAVVLLFSLAFTSQVCVRGSSNCAHAGCHPCAAAGPAACMAAPLLLPPAHTMSRRLIPCAPAAHCCPPCCPPCCRTGPASACTSPSLASCWASCPSSGPLVSTALRV